MAKEGVDDLGMSLRFKHGIHTIFLFVDPLSPFSKITDELLETLRDVYPDGLEDIKIPEPSDEVHVSYAVLKNPKDPHSGWKNLGITGSETPVGKKIKENTALAFALQTDDADPDDEPEFYVEVPTDEQEEGDEIMD